MESVSDTCIIPIQDYLVLGAEARMNRPSTLEGNWTWRLEQGRLDGGLTGWIRRITEITERL
jgi:4-alpha-glucanotransferase